MSYRETVRRHKQLIIIVAAIGAIASYMLPLDSLFAAQGATHSNNNANSNAMSSNTKHSSNGDTGKSKTGTTTTNTNNGGSKKSGDTCFGGPANICAQIGGPGDNGNIGHGNTGTNNIGTNNNGNGNFGNNNNGNGNEGNNDNGNNNQGDFCGSGKGHHYGCLQHNPHVTG